MEIEYSLQYTVTSSISAKEFIQAVDQALQANGNRLDNMDMGDAVAAAVELYETQELFNWTDEEMLNMSPGSWIRVQGGRQDADYDYIDCPDKDTVLMDDGSVMMGTDRADYSELHSLTLKLLGGEFDLERYNKILSGLIAVVDSADPDVKIKI